MSDNEPMISTTSVANQQIQTPENTIPPFEASPTDIETPKPNPPKKKRIRLTPKQRAAKIAAGWNPPGPRPQGTVPSPQQSETISAVPKTKGPTEAEVLLKSLVDKLVALENDPQYRAVWTHYFVHGGVYNGPKYVEQLSEAIQYLIRTESAKGAVAK